MLILGIGWIFLVSAYHCCGGRRLCTDLSTQQKIQMWEKESKGDAVLASFFDVDNIEDCKAGTCPPACNVTSL